MENLQKSLYFDRRTLSLRGVSLFRRIVFIFNKYGAILQILLIGKGHFRINQNRFLVNSISEVGTIHSSIIDFYDDIVLSDVIANTNHPRIVDVGANIGQFSNAVLFFFPNAEIVAFEPDPVIYDKYLRNINRNSHSVTIHNYGLGNLEFKKVFYRHKLSGMSSFVKPPSVNIASRTTLQIRKLDSFKLEKVDILKIDVEGFEYDVLLGAKKMLKKSDYLLLELSLKRGTKDTNLQILELVSSLNRNAHLIKFGRPLGKVSQPECQDVLMMLKESEARKSV